MQHELSHAEVKALVAQLAVVFEDPQQYRQLLCCRDLQAQQLIDLFQNLLDNDTIWMDSTFRRNLVVAAQRLSNSAKCLPTCYNLGEIELVENDSVAAGAYADIYKARFRGHTVCMKVIRIFAKSDIDSFFKAFAAEAIIWGQLSHPNLLPIYGLYKYKLRPCLVSPWMENRDINHFLAEQPNADRHLLILDIAKGVAYLHAKDIVHGDLKGANILVDDAGRACVADFGLSSVSGAGILDWTTNSAIGSKGGSTRWQAPELFSTDDDDIIHNSKATDVYAFSSTSYEVFTGKLPFHEVYRVEKVIRNVQMGAQPSRPPDSSPSWTSWGLTEFIWSLMEACWNPNPQRRPKIHEIMIRLTLIAQDDIRPAGVQSHRTALSFRRSLEAQPNVLSATGLQAILDEGAHIQTSFTDSKPSDRSDSQPTSGVTNGGVANQVQGPSPILENDSPNRWISEGDTPAEDDPINHSDSQNLIAKTSNQDSSQIEGLGLILDQKDSSDQGKEKRNISNPDFHVVESTPLSPNSPNIPNSPDTPNSPTMLSSPNISNSSNTTAQTRKSGFRRKKSGHRKSTTVQVNDTANTNFSKTKIFDGTSPSPMKRTVSLPDDPYKIVVREVKALLNRLHAPTFDFISDKIIAYANHSEKERDGATLILVIGLVVEKAVVTRDMAQSIIYAKLCRKMMENISPHIEDDSIKNPDQRYNTDGRLVRRYLLDRCQGEFERRWLLVYPDRTATIQERQRQRIHLMTFLGELFKVGMITHRVIHECVKKLLSNIEYSEEIEAESLCVLLTETGAMLDVPRARAFMDVYFSRIQRMEEDSKLSSRARSMLQGIIELRKAQWRRPEATESEVVKTPRTATISISDPIANSASKSSPKLPRKHSTRFRKNRNSKNLTSVNDLSEEQMMKRIAADSAEFFAVRDLNEAELYFANLPPPLHFQLVNKLTSYAVESKPVDGQLLADLFARIEKRKLCSRSAFEEGFMPISKVIDDIAIDAPKAIRLFANVVENAKLDDEQKKRLESHSKTLMLS